MARLDIETLDSRMLMSASPPSEAAAAPAEFIVATLADEGALDRAIIAVQAEDHVIGGVGNGTFMPNPDDDDDWGPWGPWVKQGLGRLATYVSDRLVRETPILAMQGGGTAMPNPDDDTPWPPGIGPVIKSADDLYLVVANNVLADLSRVAGPDPTPWSPESLQAQFSRQLEQLAGPTPEPWIDWRAVVQAVGGTGGSGIGYPAPDDDDDDWGPWGPWVHEALVNIATSFADRFAQDVQVMMAHGGGAGQPSPDDDSTWPPGVGPLIKTADELYTVIAANALHDFPGFFGTEMELKSAGQLQEYIELQLFLWLRDPDPEFVVDWNSVIPQDTITIADLPGDVNGDRAFDSSDLVTVFQAGKYEDGVAHNAVFAEGDFNGDGDFDSSDLVLAFQLGHYERERAPSGGEVDEVVQLIY
jgi:hypothetical protein